MRASRFLTAIWLCVAGCDSVPVKDADASADGGITARGEIFVARRGCPNCHQSSDPADGTLSGSTIPRLGTQVYAANLTPDDETGLGRWSDDDIARAIRQGFALGFVPLCSQMSRFDHMSDDEVIAIIAYLRSLPPVRRAIPPSVCPPIKPQTDAATDG